MDSQEFARREARRNQVAKKVAQLKKLPKPPTLVRGGDSVFLSHSNIYPTHVRQQKLIRQEQELANRCARFTMKQMMMMNSNNDQERPSSPSSPSSFLNNTQSSTTFSSNTFSSTGNMNNNNVISPSAAAAKAQLREKQRQWLVHIHVARFLHIPLQAAKILAMVKLRKLFAPVIRRARVRIKKKRRMAWLLIASQWKMKKPTVEVLKEKCNFFKFWPDDVLQNLLDTHMVPASDTLGNVLVMGGTSSSSKKYDYDQHFHTQYPHQPHRPASPSSNASPTTRPTRSSSPLRLGTSGLVASSPSPSSSINRHNSNNATSTAHASGSTINALTTTSSTSISSSPIACDVYISDTSGDLAIYSAKQLHPWSAVDEITQTKLVKGKEDAGQVLIGDLSIAAVHSANKNKKRSPSRGRYQNSPYEIVDDHDHENNDDDQDDFSSKALPRTSSFLQNDTSTTTKQQKNTTTSHIKSIINSQNNNHSIIPSDAFRFSLELRVVGSGLNFFWRIPHNAVYESFEKELSTEQKEAACRAARCDYLELTAPLDHSRLQHALSQWEDIQWPSEFITKLKSKLKPEFFPKGSILYHEGEKPPRQFILTVSGAVTLHQKQQQQTTSNSSSNGTTTSPRQQHQQYALGTGVVPIPKPPPPQHSNNPRQSPSSVHHHHNTNVIDSASSMMLMMDSSAILSPPHSSSGGGSPAQLHSPQLSTNVHPIGAGGGGGLLSQTASVSFLTDNNQHQQQLSSPSSSIIVDRIGPWTILDLELNLVCGSRRREQTAVCATDVEAWVCDFRTVRRMFIVEFATFALAARQSFQKFVASSMWFLSETMKQLNSISETTSHLLPHLVQQQQHADALLLSSRSMNNKGGHTNKNISSSNKNNMIMSSQQMLLQQQQQLLQQQKFFRGAFDTTTTHLARAMKQTTLFQLLPLEFLLDLCNGQLLHPITGNPFVMNLPSSSSSSSVHQSPPLPNGPLPRPIPHCTLPGDSLLQNLSSSSGETMTSSGPPASSGLPSFAVVVKGSVVLRVIKENEKTVTPAFIPPKNSINNNNNTSRSATTTTTTRGPLSSSSSLPLMSANGISMSNSLLMNASTNSLNMLMVMPTTCSSSSFEDASSALTTNQHHNSSSGSGDYHHRHPNQSRGYHSNNNNSNNNTTTSGGAGVTRRNMVDALRDEITSERDPTVFLPHFVTSPSLLGCSAAMMPSRNTDTSRKALPIAVTLASGGQSTTSMQQQQQQTSSNSDSSSNTNNTNTAPTLNTAVGVGKTTVSAADDGCVYWWEVPVELVQRGLIVLAMMHLINVNYFSSSSHSSAAAASVNHNSATSTSSLKMSKKNNSTSSSNRVTTAAASSSTKTATSSRRPNTASHQQQQSSSNNNNNNNNSSSIFSLNDVAATFTHNQATVTHGRSQQVQRALLANIGTMNASAQELAMGYWDQLVRYCREQTMARGSRYGGMLV